MSASRSSEEIADPSPATSVANGDRESVRQLRFASVIAPFAMATLLELSHALLDPIFSPWVDRLLVISLVLIAAVVFYHHVFERLERLQSRLRQQNQELLGLHTAGLLVSADLSLDSVLETVVHSARELIETRYGALSVIDEAGRIRHFLTSGLSQETSQQIGPLPTGHGILSVVLQQGERLRLDNIQNDERSIGFPEHHPIMRSLLAVPIVCRCPFRGNLYLSEKEDSSAFSAEEEETLVRFAHQAAVAIDNAYLHSQVKDLGAARERIRIAHEMHDGLAQVLAYVNTKAQVVKECLRQERSAVAEEHLDQLANASRKVYDDVRAQILELRTTAPNDRGLVESLRSYIEQWEQLTQLKAALRLPKAIDLAPDVELQLLRIVQESLTNVRKHSGASRVALSLESVDNELRLTIEDDGSGFDPSAVSTSTPPYSPRFGLATMRERAEAVGGHWSISSTPGHGTRITARLPQLPHSMEVETS
ncbi:MAG: GAF domain-containing sensor histidine kinase [Thermoanaerobaculia bacterium]|nr:GAF domain-containing sensor histidine kinase [Thermoanaerobaculia bacterium]